MQELLAPTRAAVERYGMIQPGDRIAVGVSGGKDSVLLLALLARLRRFYPAPFTLTALTLDPCFGGEETDYSPITALCREWGIPHEIRRTRLWEVVFRQRREPNPCSLCARMRRGGLHRLAGECGCNVVALGHHKDDAAETLLMNLFSGGTAACFSPKSYLTRRGLWLVRPMVFLDESAVRAAVRKAGLPVIKSRCPADGCTRRQQTKELLAALSEEYGPLADRLVGAMQKGNISRWG
ncbi:MAG TPA: tRNA 2-thiocytidine biosynthesis TtcA family protein [Firmicutes bacterium]|nr:tRNA 2-thiocytidine biosynthesis TtcA family protein [Bacillota bacterium]